MTRDEMRSEYLALETDQERADYIWTHRTSGAKLRLAPSQYPTCAPTHKSCKRCGGEGEVVKRGGEQPNDTMIKCGRCGIHTEWTWSANNGWRLWDDGKAGTIESDQISLFDIGAI